MMEGLWPMMDYDGRWTQDEGMESGMMEGMPMEWKAGYADGRRRNRRFYGRNVEWRVYL